MIEYKFVCPPVKIPESLQDLWGSEWGFPILDEERNLLGYASRMPCFEGDVVEAINLDGEIIQIIG